MELQTILIPVGIIVMLAMVVLKVLDVLVEQRTHHLREQGIGPAKRQWGKGWSPTVIPYIGFIYSDDHKGFDDPIITKSVMAQRFLVPLLGLCFVGWFSFITFMMMR